MVWESDRRWAKKFVVFSYFTVVFFFFFPPCQALDHLTETVPFLVQCTESVAHVSFDICDQIEGIDIFFKM